MNIRKVLASLVVLSILFGAFGVTPAVAEGAVKLSVSPVSFDFAVNPGQTETNVIKVTNPSDSAVEVEARVENIAGADQKGQVQLTEEETKFSLSKWVTTSPSRLTLGARETKLVTFSIKVPANAEPGGHYGSILIGTIAADSNITGSATVQRVGSLLLVRVAGQSIEKAIVSSFNAKSFVGGWDEVKSADNSTTFYLPKEELTDKEKVKNYFSQGPIAFNLAIRNQGNIHVKPMGFVTIYNIFGKKVAELAIDQKNVFPGVERDLTVIWPQKSFWGIYYRAQLVGVYGQNNQTLTSETSFWAFPFTAALTILAVVILVIIARKRLFKVLQVLVKG